LAISTSKKSIDTSGQKAYHREVVVLVVLYVTPGLLVKDLSEVGNLHQVVTVDIVAGGLQVLHATAFVVATNSVDDSKA
jgi:hypothetical protein